MKRPLLIFTDLSYEITLQLEHCEYHNLWYLQKPNVAVWPKNPQIPIYIKTNLKNKFFFIFTFGTSFYLLIIQVVINSFSEILNSFWTKLVRKVQLSDSSSIGFWFESRTAIVLAFIHSPNILKIDNYEND